MPKIKQEIVDRILNTAKIEEVIGESVTLRKRGPRFVGLCPFHEDRHLGNFVVVPEKVRNNQRENGFYKCFACDAKGTVVDFLMKHDGLSYPDAIRYLGRKYNIDTEMDDLNYTPPPPRPELPPLPTLHLPMQMVSQREHTENDNLVNWIRTIRWDYVSRQRIDEMLHEYHIGHSDARGFTIFWQIDEEKNVRTGKLMLYKPDGHRDRDTRYNFDFIHSLLARRRDAQGRLIEEGPYPYPHIYNPDEQEARQTLFGMHLLERYSKQATVNIVESEKTALLMAIAYGNHKKDVWMACGGLENLSRERLAPIIDRHRKIVLYPDRDGVEKWRIKAEQLHYERLSVNAEPVLNWWRECDGPKADIADVVVRIINENDPPQTIADVARRNPKIKPLIDKLGLDIAPDDDTKH